MDYALFIDGLCVGVVEAKRGIKDVPGRLGQSKRYARHIQLAPDETRTDGPYLDGFRVPFRFVTNGRPYVKQLATKSGIWFWDARPGSGDPRALPEWFSPRDLTERLEQVTGNLAADADRELGVTGLRPYQNDAIVAVEAAGVALFQATVRSAISSLPFVSGLKSTATRKMARPTTVVTKIGPDRPIWWVVA